MPSRTTPVACVSKTATLTVTLLIPYLLFPSVVCAWVSLRPPCHRSLDVFTLQMRTVLGKEGFDSLESARRTFLGSIMLATGTILSSPRDAHALVKGNAPPSKMKPTGEKPKCTNVEECQAMAARRDEEDKAENLGPPPSITATGLRYRDLQSGDASNPPAKDGDQVTMFYKVLKLGKRSYDGLSGEGTVVFSRGYGLEDDEKEPGVKSFQSVIGSIQNIGALNEALVGMHVGGIRRFSILPQKGWERPTAMCDGGPGGRGAGGDLKTDYVVVPTATMVATEACFDQTKLPFPTTYAEQRRMAQRFDQSLIMEVQLLSIQPPPV